MSTIKWFAIETDRKYLLKTGNYIIISSEHFSEPHSTGWVAISHVQCPRCGNIFKQKIDGGCFGGMTTPMACACGFPWKRDDIQ